MKTVSIQPLFEFKVNMRKGHNFTTLFYYLTLLGYYSLGFVSLQWGCTTNLYRY